MTPNVSVTRILVMETLPLAEVKARFSAVVDSVHDTHERVTITRNGKPAAVLIAPEDLAVLEETLEVLSSPTTMKRLREAEEDIARGDVLTQDELLETLSKARGGRR